MSEYATLLSPVSIGPVPGPQPRRLELAPDEPGTRPPPHRRPARLSPGASARRRRRDLHRGDGRSPDRTPDRTHDRRLPARGRARLPPPQRCGPRRGRQDVRAAVPRRAGADRLLPQAAGGRAVGRAQPALQVRAAGADRTRDLRADRRVRRLRAPCRRRRPRRRGDFDGARLPPRPVLLGAQQPPHRPVRLERADTVRDRGVDRDPGSCARRTERRRSACRATSWCPAACASTTASR